MSQIEVNKSQQLTMSVNVDDEGDIDDSIDTIDGSIDTIDEYREIYEKSLVKDEKVKNELGKMDDFFESAFKDNSEKTESIEMSDEEWRKLTPEQQQEAQGQFEEGVFDDDEDLIMDDTSKGLNKGSSEKTESNYYDGEEEHAKKNQLKKSSPSSIKLGKTTRAEQTKKDIADMKKSPDKVAQQNTNALTKILQRDQSEINKRTRESLDLGGGYKKRKKKTKRKRRKKKRTRRKRKRKKKTRKRTKRKKRTRRK